MEITNITPLYRYVDENGSIIHTPDKRNEGDEIYKYSLVADEGYELYYNGENQHTSALYVKDIEGWSQEVIELNAEEERKEK